MSTHCLCCSCEQNSKHDVGGNDDDYHHHAKSFPLFTLYNIFFSKNKAKSHSRLGKIEKIEWSKNEIQWNLRIVNDG